MIRVRASVREVTAARKPVRDGRAVEVDQTEGDARDYELAAMAIMAVVSGDDTFRRAVCRMMWGPDGAAWADTDPAVGP